MMKKALPILAVGMTVVAAFLAVQYNQRTQMLKAIKAKNAGADTSGMTEAQRAVWAKL